MKMNHVSDYLASILERLKVQYPDTLFPPDWKALTQTRCPLCGCKLYQLRNTNWLCKSVKHKRRFVIKDNLFKEIVENFTKVS